MVLFAVANEAHTDPDEAGCASDPDHCTSTGYLLDDVITGMLQGAEGLCERAGTSDVHPGNEDHCDNIMDIFGMPVRPIGLSFCLCLAH